MFNKIKFDIERLQWLGERKGRVETIIEEINKALTECKERDAFCSDMERALDRNKKLIQDNELEIRKVKDRMMNKLEM